ncbi:ATP12 chaperone protein [Ketogulonicigenium robustum]|uniref:ATP12 chaperone protein n=1 Tax=Ketogulonicigenium robustum TaxID=92947 RepID=A0A1W6P2F7_9RHOB|nr:ATP12 family protein [Ketogulonicigenium robustum]ARO15520.1 ATP12 chaperone protein [Ketogulonicigenium robustum]
MADWAPKRFWTDVTTQRHDSGQWAVLLDGRSVRTPAKVHLLTPTEAMAESVAAEWRAQGEHLRPHTMPHTRAVNVAIDHIAHKRPEVIAEIAQYAGTDLLSYRADAPEDLIAHQAAAWDPLLDWAARTFDARLFVQNGIMPIAQNPAALAKLHAAVATRSDIQLAALHDLVGLSGSLVLGLAVAEGHLPAQSAWDLSRLDEAWQIAQWGEDEEAAEMTRTKHASFLSAAQLYAVSL